MLPTSAVAAARPMTGSVVARLRGEGAERPLVDPGLAGGLRDWLEDALAPSVAALAPDAAPVRISKETINQVLLCEAGHLARQQTAPGVSVELVRGALVDALFRQWVTVGRVADPFEDALGALAVDPGAAVAVEWVAALSANERGALAEEVAAHAARIATDWPVPSPAWLARTQERLSVPLAGGRVLLSGVVDLALGAPSTGRASVCVVEVKSGRRRVEHRGDIHLYALLETLRSGAPPFRVGTYYSATGELDVEQVGRDVLVSALHRVLAGAERIVALAAGAEAPRRPNPLCPGCPGLPRCEPGRRRVADRGATS